jgi:hypothetical protein
MPLPFSFSTEFPEGTADLGGPFFSVGAQAARAPRVPFFSTIMP